MNMLNKYRYLAAFMIFTGLTLLAPQNPVDSFHEAAEKLRRANYAFKQQQTTDHAEDVMMALSAVNLAHGEVMHSTTITDAQRKQCMEKHATIAQKPFEQYENR